MKKLSETKSRPAGEEKKIIEQKPEVKEQTSFMPGKTLILIGLLALITVLLLILALYPTVAQFYKTPKGNAHQAPKMLQTNLSIATPTLSAGSLTTYTTNVMLSTERSKIVAIQLKLAFDPKVLTKVDIIPAAFFTNPAILRKEIDAVNGKITYVFGIGPGQKPVTAQGAVAVIKFTPLMRESTIVIDFAPNSKVISSDQVQSVLTSTRGMQFSFGPTPTP
jgi:hypothetical protein